jgi:hypothetical protein
LEEKKMSADFDGGILNFTPQQQAEREQFVNLLRMDLCCTEGESIRQAIARHNTRIKELERMVKQRDEIIESQAQIIPRQGHDCSGVCDSGHGTRETEARG